METKIQQENRTEMFLNQNQFNYNIKENNPQQNSQNNVQQITQTKLQTVNNSHKPVKISTIILISALTAVIVFLILSLTVFLIFKNTQYFQLQTKSNNQIHDNPLTQSTAQIPSNLQSNNQCNRTNINEKWVNFEEPKFTGAGFKFENTRQNILPFSHIISKDIKIQKIKILIIYYTWDSPIWIGFNIRIRTLNGQNQESVHWIRAITLPLPSGGAFNSQQIILQCSTVRQIRVKSYEVHPSSQLNIAITGYLPA